MSSLVTVFKCRLNRAYTKTSDLTQEELLSWYDDWKAGPYAMREELPRVIDEAGSNSATTVMSAMTEQMCQFNEMLQASQSRKKKKDKSKGKSKKKKTVPYEDEEESEHDE